MFFVAAVVLLILVFDDGGYDIVSRHHFGIALWAAIALGVAFGVLPRGVPGPGPAAWVAVGAIGALAAYTALALAWTDSDERTFAELGRVLMYGGVVLLAYLSLNRHTWRAAAGGLAAAALIVPVFSIIARLFPDLITDETARAFDTDRLSYPLGYWNAVAAWGAMAIAIGIVWSAHGRTQLTRALAGAAVPIAALSVYLTYSRAGVIAVVVAVFAAGAFGRNRWTMAANAVVAALASAVVIAVAHGEPEIARATGDGGAGVVLLALLAASGISAAVAIGTMAAGLDRARLERTTAIMAVAFGFTILVSAIAPIAHNQIGDAWDEFRNERSVAVGDDPTQRLTTFGGNRYDAWGAALDAFEGDRVRGIGPGTYEFFWSREGDDPQFFRDAHSLYLEQLAELGVLGLFMILVFLIALLVAALSTRRHLERSTDIGAAGAAISAFAVFAVYAGVDWMWEMSAVGVLALGGIAIAGAATSRRWGPLPLGGPARAALIAVALLAIAVQIPPLVSTERLRASATELNEGSVDRAEDLADESVRAEPWAASPYAHRALVKLERSQFEEARTDLEKAVEKEPTNWRHHFLLARVEAEAGKLANVKQQLAEVKRLAPHSPYLIPGHPERVTIDELLRTEIVAGGASQPAP